MAGRARAAERFRPAYHAAPPSGWMNDPNGLCYFRGEYHLFYQHNPAAPRWGKMHWGHAVSRDLVAWEHLPVALAPDMPYERLLGCFSGTALVDGDTLRLMYTGVSALGQRQCLARSSDGRTFEKDPGNPVIRGAHLPRGSSVVAFRDPKLLCRGSDYYCIAGAGARGRRSGRGRLLLFRSRDLRDWSYAGVLYSCPDSPMLECPDLVPLDGRSVLLISPTELPGRGDEFQNLHSAVYVVGEADFEAPGFRGGPYREIDGGFDFYAPQTLATPDGRTIMIAWMNMWKRSMPTEAEGWAGAMTLPRELSLRGDRLVQRPAREIERHRRCLVAYRGLSFDGELSLPGVEGDRVELIAEIDMESSRRVELRLFAGPGGRVALAYDRDAELLSFDRGACGEVPRELDRGGAPSALRARRLSLGGGPLRLRVFLDRSSVELFAQDGELAMTGTAYPGPGQAGVELASEGRARLVSLEKYDIA